MALMTKWYVAIEDKRICVEVYRRGNKTFDAVSYDTFEPASSCDPKFNNSTDACLWAISQEKLY